MVHQAMLVPVHSQCRGVMFLGGGRGAGGLLLPQCSQKVVISELQRSNHDQSAMLRAAAAMVALHTSDSNVQLY